MIKDAPHPSLVGAYQPEKATSEKPAKLRPEFRSASRKMAQALNSDKKPELDKLYPEEQESEARVQDSQIYRILSKMTTEDDQGTFLTLFPELTAQEVKAIHDYWLEAQLMDLEDEAIEMTRAKAPEPKIINGETNLEQ